MVFSFPGLPVYFIEPLHPEKFFWRGQVYGEHDDFKRFSFFSRAALELLLQAGKSPDIIHCHDWQTAFVVRVIYLAVNSLALTHSFILSLSHTLSISSIDFLVAFLGSSLLGSLYPKGIEYS